MEIQKQWVDGDDDENNDSGDIYYMCIYLLLLSLQYIVSTLNMLGSDRGG